MIRNIKVLGLAVVAMLAMTAVVASAAQATTTFTAGSTTGTLKATQTGEQIFTTHAGTVRCTGSTQEGKYIAAKFSSTKVTAAYTGCKAFGILNATINMNGCEYEFVGQASGTLANASVICPAGKDITVVTLTCVVHVEPQTGIGHILFSNNLITKPDDVDATATLTGIKYTTTEGCPGVGVGKTTTNGTLTGGATIKAFDTTGTQVDLTVDD